MNLQLKFNRKYLKGFKLKSSLYVHTKIIAVLYYTGFDLTHKVNLDDERYE